MSRILFFTLLFYSMGLMAQIRFEPGYLIDNSGAKTELLIRNVDWKNNPDRIETKLTAEAETVVKSIVDITEFGIHSGFKYRRFLVNIDQSSDDPGEMSLKKEPEFISQIVFLKLISEGKLNLYEYEKGNLIRFFMGKADAVPEALIFKEYIIRPGMIAKNNRFMQQLHQAMAEQPEQQKDLERLRYKRDPLLKLFRGYNGTTELAEQRTANASKKFRLRVIAGVQLAKVHFESNISTQTFDIKSKPAFLIGAEAEFLLPFNNQKWALFASPTYNRYSGSESSSVANAELEYSFLDLSDGARHYMYLNQDYRISIEMMFNLSFDLNSELKYNGTNLEISKTSNIAVGIGFGNKTYGASLRYYFPKSITPSYVFRNCEYSSVGIVLHYNLF